jgi:hypothetical protein
MIAPQKPPQASLAEIHDDFRYVIETALHQSPQKRPHPRNVFEIDCGSWKANASFLDEVTHNPLDRVVVNAPSQATPHLG